jgi:hypothetical protein
VKNIPSKRFFMCGFTIARGVLILVVTESLDAEKRFSFNALGFIALCLRSFVRLPSLFIVIR